MRKTEKERLRKLLLAKRTALVKDIEMTMESQISTTIKESTGDISSYSYHMADQGTDAMNRELAFMYASKSGRLLYHIDEALRRLDGKDFGKCSKCQKNINMERLVAVPHARMCIECKSTEEDAQPKRK